MICSTSLRYVGQVRSEIDIFLREKDFAHCEISDPEWISNLAFLVDITKHLNTLNLQLQGRSQLINVLYERICAFEIKLCLWEAQLKSRNFTHFPHLIENQPKDIALHVSYVSDLRSQFANRFSDLRKYEPAFRLFGKSMDFKVANAPGYLQMELIELQCSSEQRTRFQNMELIDYYKQLSTIPDFSGLVVHAKKIACSFGSTYL